MGKTAKYEGKVYVSFSKERVCVSETEIEKNVTDRSSLWISN